MFDHWRMLRYFQWWVIGVIQFIFLGLLSGQVYESIAVLDLEGRGISHVEAASLTDRLRSALVQSNQFTIVERNQMQEILAEQNFQLTGCTTDECAVEVGQLLGVTMMIAGSVGKLGNTYSIDIRTIDVETGTITHSIIQNYRGKIDGLLDEMENVAMTIAEGERPRHKRRLPRFVAFTATISVAYIGYSTGLFGLFPPEMNNGGRRIDSPPPLPPAP